MPLEARKSPKFSAKPPTSAANKAPLDVQGRGRYSFRWCRRACFGLFLADFGLFLANFRSLGGGGGSFGRAPLAFVRRTEDSGDLTADYG